MDNVFHDHPVIGFIATILTLMVAELSKHVMEIPFIVMQLFQIAAWASAIVVGCITVHGWYIKNFNNNKNETGG